MRYETDNLHPRTETRVHMQTRNAMRLYRGNPNATIHHEILGLQAISELLSIMENAIKLDDPYADYYYILFEDEINKVDVKLSVILDEINMHHDVKTPPTMELMEAIGRKKTTIEINFSSTLNS